MNEQIHKDFGDFAWRPKFSDTDHNGIRTPESFMRAFNHLSITYKYDIDDIIKIFYKTILFVSSKFKRGDYGYNEDFHKIATRIKKINKLDK